MDYYYTYNYDAVASDPTGSFISLAVNIVALIALWKLFAKAGVEGWKALIPFYNGYLQFKIAWRGEIFWQMIAIVLSGCIASVLLFFAGDFLMYLGILLFIAVVVYTVVIQSKFCNRLARAYGKSSGFAVGLFFLGSIFLCILAFGKSEYQGPQA